MRPVPASRMTLVRKHEKALRLTRFMRSWGEDREPQRVPFGIPDPETEWLVVARSADSPVVCAVRSLLRDWAKTEGDPSLNIRLLLLMEEPYPGETTPDPDNPDLDMSVVRIVRDRRFLDAHEHLVLGHASVWTGDTMRRDPARCDALEHYGQDCRIAARLARRFFQRLWTTARPPKHKRPSPPSEGTLALFPPHHLGEVLVDLPPEATRH